MEMIREQAAQDERDGAALRRLLDIWPRNFHLFPDGPGWRVVVYVANSEEWQWDSGVCDTIAEAADRCREAFA